MTRVKIPKIVSLMAVLLVVAAGGLVIARRGHLPLGRPHTAGLYYCPMHPTYTSDRPGNCPICNMTLVKRDTTPGEPSRPQPSSPQASARPDVCHLHNCPLAHAGQPCPMLVVSKVGEEAVCPICGKHVVEAQESPERPILYWTDPMLPGYRADKPGKSPMGMDLVPVYAEADGAGEAASAPAGYAPILVTPQKQQLIGVTTALAQTRTITKTIRTVGRIAYDPELYQTEQEYLQALKSLAQARDGAIPEAMDQAQQLVESGRMRLRLMGLSPELIEEIGTWSGPDQSLLLADAGGHLWLYAPIYEFELPFVKPGQTVTVEASAVPGKTWQGTVRAVDSVLDAATRSARVRAVLTDPDGTLKPEMFVNASIVVNVGDVLTVPNGAVFNTGMKRIVFVDKGRGLFEPRDVTLGAEADGYDEVKAGISEGEQVVTSGNFLIDSESRLKAALDDISGNEAHPHGQ